MIIPEETCISSSFHFLLEGKWKPNKKPKSTNQTPTKTQTTHTHAHTHKEKKKENKKIENEKNKRTSTQIRKEDTHTLSDKGIRKILMQ